MRLGSDSPGDPQEAAPQGDTSGPTRSTRSLGRGLEEVSHLFLSPTKEATGDHSGVPNPAPGRPAGRPAARAGVAVLRPRTGLTKDQLTATLFECQDALERCLRTLDIAVPCGPYGAIDVLALARSNQLTVIDVETTPCDSLLLRGMSHVDWVSRNVASLQRTYQGVTIDASQPSRLLLVAPAFSPLLRSAARLAPRVSCFRYLEVTVSAGAGIVVERLRDEDS